MNLKKIPSILWALLAYFWTDLSGGLVKEYRGDDGQPSQLALVSEVLLYIISGTLFLYLLFGGKFVTIFVAILAATFLAAAPLFGMLWNERHFGISPQT